MFGRGGSCELISTEQKRKIRTGCRAVFSIGSMRITTTTTKARFGPCLFRPPPRCLLKWGGERRLVSLTFSRQGYAFQSGNYLPACPVGFRFSSQTRVPQASASTGRWKRDVRVSLSRKESVRGTHRGPCSQASPLSVCLVLGLSSLPLSVAGEAKRAVGTFVSPHRASRHADALGGEMKFREHCRWRGRVARPRPQRASLEHRPCPSG